jgi:membrane protease YdiL (CAAX protease family)
LPAEAPSSLRAWIFGFGQLRAGWRIAVFVALFFAVLLVIQSVVAALLGPGSRWNAVVGPLLAALAAGMLMLRLFDGRPAGALGFAWGPSALRESVVGFGIGGALISVVALLLVVTASANWVPDDGSWADYLRLLGDSLLFFGLAAALEEALFRGYPFQALVQGIGAWPAIVLSSLLFAFAHGRNPHVSGLALVNILLAGVWLGIAFLRTRSLWFATGAHAGWNWTMASLFDFPVSGLTMDTPLYDVRPVGVDWWTGGSFGPEGGLAATLAMLLGAGWLLRTRRVRPSPEVRATATLVDARLGPAWG